MVCLRITGPFLYILVVHRVDVGTSITSLVSGETICETVCYAFFSNEAFIQEKQLCCCTFDLGAAPD